MSPPPSGPQPPSAMADSNANRPTRPRVYVTRSIPQRGLDVLLNACDVCQWDSPQVVPRGELLNSVQGVRAILCMDGDVIDREVLDAAGPDLAVVASLSSTASHIDMEECRRRSIHVLKLPAQNVDFQASLAVRLMVQTLRDTANNNMNYDNGHVCINNNLRNKTFGIFGLTDLGHAVTRRLNGMDVGSVIAVDPQSSSSSSGTTTTGATTTASSDDNAASNAPELVSWSSLLSRSDVIFICCEETDHSWFDKETFKLMKNGAVLVNSIKGSCVDYWALYEALKRGEISAAGLNDCHQQPVPFRSPLEGLSNCVFLPQAQEGTDDLRHKISVTLAKNMVACLNINGMPNGVMVH